MPPSSPHDLLPPTVSAARDARERIGPIAVRTPLLRLERGENGDVRFKAENLQPIGSFKLRGAANAMLSAAPGVPAEGVYTASAGNMAQGVAWCARRLGIPCQVIVPEHAPATKIAAIERLGGAVLKVPFDVWWQTMVDHQYPGMTGLFVHPFADTAVMAGNATLALEILEDAPDVGTVYVPWGGGGLCCGIAAVIKALKPGVRVCAVEVETAAPLTASRKAGKPVTITAVRSFVDGIGGKGVAAEMWPLAQSLVDGVVVVGLTEVAQAIRLLAERSRVVAEGAGGAAVAAALRHHGADAVAIVSGGNINSQALAAILGGDLPEEHA